MIGTTTFHSNTGADAPSSLAASSNSRGTSRMNTPISHNAIGRLSVACANTRPLSVPSRPTNRAIEYHALPSATGGVI